MLYQKDPALQPRSSDIDKERHREELDAFHSDIVAQRAKDRVERQLEITTTQINHEYRKRIKEAREMIDRLSKSSAELATERSFLREAREVLLEYLGRLQNPIKLNLQWVQLRKNHRRSSLGNQGVSEAMDNSHRDLRGAVLKLTSALTDVDVAMKRVDECVEAHQREIKDKNTTVVLDSACLLPNLEVPVRDENSVKLHSSVVRRTGLHTEQEYQNNVAALISSAPPIRQTAKQVVARAKAVCRWIVENGYLERPTHVVDVLKSSVQDSEKQQKQLEYNAKMIQGQMLALEKNRAQLLGTLEKVHQKVVETQRRLDMKLVRPIVDDSRRDIDEELERATTSLLQSELSIKNQLFDVETRRQRLILLYQDIETELQSKKRAYAVDMSCLNAQISQDDLYGHHHHHKNNNSSSGRRGTSTSSNNNNSNNQNGSGSLSNSGAMYGAGVTSGRRQVLAPLVASGSSNNNGGTGLMASSGSHHNNHHMTNMTMRSLQQQSHLMMGDGSGRFNHQDDNNCGIINVGIGSTAKTVKTVKFPPLVTGRNNNNNNGAGSMRR